MGVREQSQGCSHGNRRAAAWREYSGGTNAFRPVTDWMGGKWGLSPKLWAGLREGAYPRAGVGCQSGEGAAWEKGERTDLGLNLGTEV